MARTGDVPEGVAATVAPGEAARLVDFAKAHLAVIPVGEIGPLIARGAVWIGDRIGRIDDRVAAGDVVRAVIDGGLVPLERAIAVVHEDADLLVCDKPAGMHVHPIGAHRADTLVNALLWYAGARADQPWAPWRPYVAHRLDRAASGLVAIAKRAEVHDAFRALLERGAVDRRYRALVAGVVRDDAGTIDAPLGRDPTFDYRRAVVAGGQPAITHWRVVERFADRTRVELELATGRTHQIRAHLAHLGHPIVGDTLYAGATESAPAIELRAVALAFPHPITGAPIACRVD